MLWHNYYSNAQVWIAYQGWYTSSVVHCVLSPVVILGQQTVLVDVLKDAFVLMDKFYQITNVSMKVHVQVSKVLSISCLYI